jgi:hypothetical protein
VGRARGHDERSPGVVTPDTLTPRAPNVEAARILCEGAPLSLMDGQWDEPDAAPSEPPA